MPTSQNGWSAAPDLALRPLIIDGVSFVPGIRDDDDVATVLGYVLTQFHERVEPLTNPGCWGFSYRENRNDPNSLSNHSSATAVDANAPAHPNGVPTAATFTLDQITTIHHILEEVDQAVRWGGDYRTTPDAMHFEINTDPTTLHAVAERLRDDMPKYRDWEPADKEALASDIAKAVAAAVWAYKIDLGGKAKKAAQQIVREIRNLR